MKKDGGMPEPVEPGPACALTPAAPARTHGAHAGAPPAFKSITHQEQQATKACA